jgi:hypothetical protein
MLATTATTIVSGVDAATAALGVTLTGVLANHAGETTSTIQGLGAVNAQIADSMNHAHFQLGLEAERAAALTRFQFPEGLCSVASGAQGAAAATATVAGVRATKEAAAVAKATSAKGDTAAVAGQWYGGRVSKYCSASDPSCGGQAGANPDGDIAVGRSLLDPLTYRGDGSAAAEAVIANMLGAPLPPALPYDAVKNTAGGREAWMKRKQAEGAWGAALAALQGIRADREASFDQSWVADVYKAAGLAAPAGQVSRREWDQTRFVTQYQANGFFDSIAAAEPATVNRALLGIVAQQNELMWRLHGDLETLIALFAPQVGMTARAQMPTGAQGLGGAGAAQ